MKLYGVYDNLDHTEGRGPMVLESMWFSRAQAVAHIQELSGVENPHGIGDTEWYGGFNYIKELATADEMPGVFGGPDRGSIPSPVDHVLRAIYELAPECSDLVGAVTPGGGGIVLLSVYSKSSETCKPMFTVGLEEKYAVLLEKLIRLMSALHEVS